MASENKFANGVLKLSRRGRSKFQFDDSDQLFSIDIIEVYDQWIEVDWQLRDTTPGPTEGFLPPSKQDEYGKNRQGFVQIILDAAYAKAGGKAPAISRAEAEEFIDVVRMEAARLRNFTLPGKEEPSSSPASSAAQPEIFSQ